jgi:hypothetical protein
MSPAAFIMKSVLTKEYVERLYAETANFAEVARRIEQEHGIRYSRESIRQNAHKYGITPICSRCHREVSSFSTVFCPDCKKQRDREKYEQELAKIRSRKTFESRPVIQDAVDFFEGCGLDVVVDRQARSGSPELLVCGVESSVRVKCYKLTRFAAGHQSRFRIVDGAELYYMSDCNGCVLLVPKTEDAKPYVGLRSPLRRFAKVQWIDKVINSINEGADIIE